MSALYILSPPVIVNLPCWLAELEAILSKHKVAYFQWRVKPDQHVNIDSTDLFSLKEICERYHVPLIINDDAVLAHTLQASGVHLGKDDALINDIRNKHPQLLIGASCYNNLDLAHHCVKDGANYVAFGSMFPSPTKKQATPAQLNTITEWKRQSSIPCVAIGGINLDNIYSVQQSGADLIAVSSAIWNHPKGAVTAVHELYKALGQ
jgi:thiamine-phosphate pyrophosphorylase